MIKLCEHAESCKRSRFVLDWKGIALIGFYEMPGDKRPPIRLAAPESVRRMRGHHFSGKLDVNRLQLFRLQQCPHRKVVFSHALSDKIRQGDAIEVAGVEQPGR